MDASTLLLPNESITIALQSPSLLRLKQNRVQKMSCPFVFQMKISSMQWALQCILFSPFKFPCSFACVSLHKCHLAKNPLYRHLYLSVVESSPCSKNLMFILLQPHLMYNTHQRFTFTTIILQKQSTYLQFQIATIC